MAQEYLRVRGAREHNLKNINVTIPRNQLTVITGQLVPGNGDVDVFEIVLAGTANAKVFLGHSP